jgi:ferredoxin-NADP reductase/ferredoxin/truncated hemoglobin YjbI
MPTLTYNGDSYVCRDDETALEALERQGVVMPSSCRSGICHVCLQRCATGIVPDSAQSSLRHELRALGYFLPCRCNPVDDMQIEPPRDSDLYTEAVIYKKEWLAPGVIRLLLEPATNLDYRPGQFINLRRPDGLSRSYSLVSNPATDYFLELHVKVMKNGTMSNWIADTIQPNDEVSIQGPNGYICYDPGDPERNLLLVGTGTGLAPLMGIARDALHQGHKGDIHLFHGSRHADGIYQREELLELCGEHPNFRYYACVSGKDVPSGYLSGRADEIARSLTGELKGWSIFLAGLPEIVSAAQADARRAGAAESDIHADPFHYTDLRRNNRQPAKGHGGRRGQDKRQIQRTPDPEMWLALREGELLKEILADFYQCVYADARLSPFFNGTTRRRSMEKQYLFLRQYFSGEKVYFGDRPRNAHHWMVISNELFDYREALMHSVLRRHGLADYLIERWLALESTFRADIVKDRPRKRVIGDLEVPVEGFGEEILEVGSLCDSCGREIQPGTRVRYHLRLGTVWCPDCMDNTEATTSVRENEIHG